MTKHMERQHFDITDFGAQGDDRTDNTAAVQKTIDTASREGGIVFFPAGVFLTGTVYLRNNTHIFLRGGAEWKGFPDEQKFDFVEPAVTSRMDTGPWRAFIFASNVSHVVIEGSGLIHPNGEYSGFQDNTDNSPARPYGMHFMKCRNILVRDITLKNSAFWMQRYLHCEHIRITGITVYNHCNLNNDGMDIDSSRDVVVSDCFIDSSDDGICIKSEGAGTAENIVVNNCIVATHASAIKLGTGSVGGFRRISIANCVIRPSAAGKMIHTLGAWGGLAGIDLGTCDGGVLQDVLIRNVTIDGVETPIFMWQGRRLSGNVARQGYGGEGEENARKEKSGGLAIATESDFDTVSISGVYARNVGPIACAIGGYASNPIKNIRLNDITIVCGKPGTQDDLNRDVPDKPELYPCNRTFGCNLPAFGFFVRHARNIRLSDIRLVGAEGESRPPVVCEDVKGLRVRDLGYTNTSHDGDDVVLKNCEEQVLERVIRE